MEANKDWTPFDLGELDTIAIDVSPFFTLDVTEAITGVVATCAVARGSPIADAAASTRLTGPAQFNMAAVTADGVRPLVLVQVQAPSDPALAGCRYVVQFKFTTNRGNTPSAYGHWFVKALT